MEPKNLDLDQGSLQCLLGRADPHAPVRMLQVVVLPAPLWPRRTVIWPWYRFMVRSLTAISSFFPL